MQRTWQLLLGTVATCWMLLGVGSSARADEPGWGGVAGRVVFVGDFADPAVQRHRGEMQVTEQITIRESQSGVQPRVIATLPKQDLLIDEMSRGVANVIVYLRKAPAQVHPSLREIPAEPLEVVYNNYSFAPRVLLARVGQKIVMTARGENATFNIAPLRNTPANPLVHPGETAEWTAKASETVPFRITCSIRPTATSYWLVLDHPYAVLSNRDGSFELKNLPAGTHQLTVWHEAIGYVSKAKFLTVSVRPGRTEKLPPIEYTTEKLR